MKSTEDRGFLLLITAVSLAFAWILWPLYGAVLWGVVAAILFAPTLIGTVYGMNFVHMPELEWEYGYLWALGLMVVVCGVLWAWFRSKDWL